MEALILEASNDWGIPPWQVETDCPRRWWEWWLIYRDEKIKEQNDQIKKMGKR